MSKKQILAALGLGAVLAFAVVLFTGGDPSTPEEMIRAAMSDMASAAGDKNLQGILAHISEDFREDGGGMDYDRLRGLLFVQLRRGTWTRVILYDTQVSMQSETLADVRTRAFLARGDGPLPSNADGWEIDLIFEKENDGRWRVISGGYKSVRRGN